MGASKSSERVSDEQTLKREAEKQVWMREFIIPRQELRSRTSHVQYAVTKLLVRPNQQDKRAPKSSQRVSDELKTEKQVSVRALCLQS